MTHASIAWRNNTVDNRTEYWSTAGFVTDIDAATLLPDKRYETAAPILTDRNTVPVDLFTASTVDTSVEAWRDEVANDRTHRGFIEWRKRREETSEPKLLVGVGQIEVYVYVDPEEGTVVRVIASDESLQDIHDLVIKAADVNQTPMYESVAAVTDEGRRYFRQIAVNNTWPAWEFCW